MKEFNTQELGGRGARRSGARHSPVRFSRAGTGRACGLIAVAIAQAANVLLPTMSHHLGILERAGLMESERESRLIHYRADYDGMVALENADISWR